MGTFKKKYAFDEFGYHGGSVYVDTRDNGNLYNGRTAKHDFNIMFDSRIRVPKLKRKTAWKRFYKRYPELKGQKVFTGRSKVYGRGFDWNNNLRESFILLKAI